MAKEQTQFVVQSRVKEHIGAADMNVAGDLVDALSVKVEQMLDEAIKRCESNGRKTVRPADL